MSIHKQQEVYSSPFLFFTLGDCIVHIEGEKFSELNPLYVSPEGSLSGRLEQGYWELVFYPERWSFVKYLLSTRRPVHVVTIYHNLDVLRVTVKRSLHIIIITCPDDTMD